jgi:hypothetical protein
MQHLPPHSEKAVFLVFHFSGFDLDFWKRRPIEAKPR